MSLFTLPVSINDLNQLQVGIEFFTDVQEATNEAAKINAGSDTVQSYANTLLANNISFSQVAMAVDSLMFGVTDTITQLAKLSTQFLPAQVAIAVANGLNPTVYSAEALGLALAGGNGTSNAFATDFGSLSAAQFASKVSSLTGINASAIQGFVQNWITFYTANPSATFGLSVTLASYGAAFGDTIGAALLNPNVNCTLALLTNEVQNALIDNAEGLYTAGIPLIDEPPHLPLQGGAVLIPDAGGPPFGASIDWATQFGPTNYAQLVIPAQSGPLTILNAPSTFTLDTQHYATNALEIDAASNSGKLCTLVVGDSTAGEGFGSVQINGYCTVHLVANAVEASSLAPFFGVAASEHDTHLVVSGTGGLNLGNISASAHEGDVSVDLNCGTMTDFGVHLFLGVTDADTIDASNAPVLTMLAPASVDAVGVSAVTVLGGISDNLLQGSLGGIVGSVTFTNGTTGVSATVIGADNITGGSGGSDLILGDGGPDTITLPNHSRTDRVGFGYDDTPSGIHVLAITDGSDLTSPGFWGAGTTPTAIPNLFPGSTGGTSADMTVITGFHAGSGGDRLIFETAAWNGESTVFGPLSTQKGDLVVFNGVSIVPVGDAQLSALWANDGSNSSLKTTDNVLRYAPSDALLQNAQQLAAQLHSSSDALILPGGAVISPDNTKHILVAYDASSNVNGTIQHAVNIADVDLVNMSADNQSSTANLNVYGSDMVHLVGVSLASLVADNIHFI